jgi:hypothetical protein
LSSPSRSKRDLRAEVITGETSTAMLALISGDVVGIKVLVPSVGSFVEPPIRHTTSLIDLLQRPLEICR